MDPPSSTSFGPSLHTTPPRKEGDNRRIMLQSPMAILHRTDAFRPPFKTRSVDRLVTGWRTNRLLADLLRSLTVKAPVSKTGERKLMRVQLPSSNPRGEPGACVAQRRRR